MVLGTVHEMKKNSAFSKAFTAAEVHNGKAPNFSFPVLSRWAEGEEMHLVLLHRKPCLSAPCMHRPGRTTAQKHGTIFSQPESHFVHHHAIGFIFSIQMWISYSYSEELMISKQAFWVFRSLRKVLLAMQSYGMKIKYPGQIFQLFDFLNWLK